MKFLSGWRTYIVALGAIITAIGAFVNGAIDITQLVTAIFAAVGTITMRSAITTTVSDATGKKL